MPAVARLLTFDRWLWSGSNTVIISESQFCSRARNLHILLATNKSPAYNDTHTFHIAMNTCLSTPTIWRYKIASLIPSAQSPGPQPAHVQLYAPLLLPMSGRMYNNVFTIQSVLPGSGRPSAHIQLYRTLCVTSSESIQCVLPGQVSHLREAASTQLAAINSAKNDVRKLEDLVERDGQAWR